MTIKLTILAFDNCVSSGITSPIDVFKTANAQLWQSRTDSSQRQFSWTIASPQGKPIRCSNGLRIQADGGLELLLSSDIVLLPGLDHKNIRELSQQVEQLTPLLKPYLIKLGKGNQVLATMCSSAFLLAEAGILNNKSATTCWWLATEFEHRYPKVKLSTKDIITEHNKLYCSGTINSYFTMCIELIRYFAGHEIATRTEKISSLDNPPDMQSFSTTTSTYVQAQDNIVKQAIQWIQQNLNRDFLLDDLSSSLSISKRTLIRRFHKALDCSPNQYLQQARVGEAKLLLESTSLTTEQIAEKVGYKNVSSLRRVFSREVKMSMTDYKTKFSISHL